jgi:hypothetical protein
VTDFRRVVRREIRVAITRNPQRPAIRILKWVIIIALIAALWRTPSFWWWIVGAAALGFGGHFFWRWKTHGWTRPWGGWNEVEAIDRD